MSKRTTLTLDDDLYRDLTYLSQRMGVSRSALVSRLLDEAVSDLRGLVEQVPESPSPETLLRLRGQSERLIDERLAEFRSTWGS